MRGAFCAGEMCAIRALAMAPSPAVGPASLALQHELHTQILLPAPRFVLVRSSEAVIPFILQPFA